MGLFPPRSLSSPVQRPKCAIEAMTGPKQDPTEPQELEAAAGASGGAAVELYTLGGVRMVQQGSEQTSKLGPKHLALLVYLFHERRPMHPTEVTELLGRGQSVEKEISALKRAVAWLNENVPGVSVRVSSDSVETVDGVWVDTRDVDAAIDRGDPEPVEQLYVGEFLEGFESGAPAFDEWAKKERGRLKRAWSHAMVSAARQCEQSEVWDSSARWWQLLVGRAPMRPEAVASLLNALANDGQEEQAAVAYFDYAALLAENGISQPADAVKQVLAEHPALQDATGLRVELPAKPAASEAETSPAEPEAAETSELEDPSALGTEPGFESLSDTLEAELEVEFRSELAVPEIQVGDEDVLANESEPEPEAEPELEFSSVWPGEEFLETEDEQVSTDDEWEDVVDIASADELDLKVGAEPDSEGAPPPSSEFDLPATHYDADAAFEHTGHGSGENDEEVGAGTVSDSFRRPNAIRRPIESVSGSLAAFGRAFKGRRILPEGLLRRFWYAPVAVAVAALVFALGPRLLGTVGQLTGELPEVSAPSLPRVNLPKVSVPKVSVKTPSFVETSVSRIGEMLSGPILDESGEWILVADFQVDALTPPDVAATGESSSLPSDEGSEAGVPMPAEGEAASTETDTSLLQASVVPPPGPITLVDEAGDSVPVEREGDPAGNDADQPAMERESLGESAELAVRASVAQDSSQRPPDAEDSTRVVETPLEQEQAPPPTEVTELIQDSVTPSPRPADSASDSGQTVERPTPPSLSGLTTALEMDLAQSNFFYVVPRERALTALRKTAGRASEGLSVQEALSLAESQGYAAVISGRLMRRDAVDSLKVLVLNPAGDTLYGVVAEVSGGLSYVETLAGLARAVRRRLGESEERIEASVPPTQFLTNSPAALSAYAEARGHLFAGRYAQALRMAREATSQDSTFALAHLTLAEAFAHGGVRTSARSALEIAWRFSPGVPERDRMRIDADRLAWDGRLSEAVVMYDELFQRFRDDVGALKSQAVLQRMIGARGGGEGNLRVAYSIDPHDWPRLSRISRYLGYGGPLPDVDSLIASLQEPEPVPEQ